MNKMDISRIHRISALLKRGDVAVRENSSECMAFYKEALRLADESNDVFRGGEVHFAIAKAHNSVTALRDPVKYEHHARQAVEAGRSLGPFGVSLVVRASVSLGNAIIEEQRRLEQPDRSRLIEARDALSFAATAEAAGAFTRGTAHNGLGNLLRMEKDFHAAADEYLAACKEFEKSRDTRSLLMAQTNCALMLAQCGRLKDARNLALQTVEGVIQDQAIAPQLLPILEAVLAATESPGNG